MTIEELLKQLSSQNYSPSQLRVVSEALIKVISLKYGAELYKVFSAADISLANKLSTKEAYSFLHQRYQEVTGNSTSQLLNQIASEVATEISVKPEDFFHLTS